jgi:hypothetical protein
VSEKERKRERERERERDEVGQVRGWRREKIETYV